MPNISRINYPSNQITFNATWNEENQHLKETTSEKISRFCLYLIHKIASIMLLPSSLTNRRAFENLSENFNTMWDNNPLLHNNFTKTDLKVTAPDGAVIPGTYFKNVVATESSPTIILFQPNAMLAHGGCFNWLLEDSAVQELPFNFVYFDYRGCDGTQSYPLSDKALFLDGESIYQFARDQLHVPESNIHMYGYSLGGGISWNVKEMHPLCTGRSANDRSYSEISDVVKNMINRSFPLPSCLTSLIASLARYILSAIRLNINAIQALEKLKGKILIIHHPKDELMQGEASLYRRIFEGQNNTPSRAISHLDLSLSGNECDFYHGTPLYDFDNHRLDATDSVSSFLFASNTKREDRLLHIYQHGSFDFRNKVHKIVAERFQRGGYYWGSGEDACNHRNGLSLTKMQLLNAIVATKRS